MNLKLNELHDKVNASALATQAKDLEYLKTAGTFQQHCVYTKLELEKALYNFFLCQE